MDISNDKYSYVSYDTPLKSLKLLAIVLYIVRFHCWEILFLKNTSLKAQAMYVHNYLYG